MTRVYYKEAVGAFIVFDVTRADSFRAVDKWKADLDTKVRFILFKITILTVQKFFLRLENSNYVVFPEILTSIVSNKINEPYLCQRI